MKQELPEISVVIIDPDSLSRESFIEAFGRQPGFRIKAIAETAEQGIIEIRREQPDVVIINIDLPDGTGFDLVQKVPHALRPQYVMTSSKANDAVRAFEYFASDFLLKPFTHDRLTLTVFKLREMVNQRGNAQLHEKLNALFRYIGPQKQEHLRFEGNGFKKRLPVKMSGRIYFIDPADIEYVEAAGYYIEVFAHGKKHLIRQSLTHLDDFLDALHFVRIHRSVIVNLKYLKEIVRDGANDFSMRMLNDTTFKISRSYKSGVFERIGLA